MNIEDFAKESSIPLKTLRFLVKNYFVENPLTEKDVIGLKFLEDLWGNRDVLRPQMALFSEKRRATFLRTVDIETKWERYAFSRFSNLEPEQNVRMKTVIQEIECTFGFKPNIFQIKRIYKVRMAVYNRRRYLKNKQK